MMRIMGVACIIIGIAMLTINLFGGPENFFERGLLLEILGVITINNVEAK